MRIVRYILFCSLALILVEAAEDEGAKKSAKGCDVTLFYLFVFQTYLKISFYTIFPWN